jgi:hypothetical protein
MQILPMAMATKGTRHGNKSRYEKREYRGQPRIPDKNTADAQQNRRKDIELIDIRVIKTIGIDAGIHDIRLRIGPIINIQYKLYRTRQVDWYIGWVERLQTQIQEPRTPCNDAEESVGQ